MAAERGGVRGVGFLAVHADELGHEVADKSTGGGKTGAEDGDLDFDDGPMDDGLELCFGIVSRRPRVEVRRGRTGLVVRPAIIPKNDDSNDCHDS